MKSINNSVAVIIIILTVFWSFNDLIPPISNSKNELKATDFSINNALYHLKNISKKAHHTGSSEHKIVQNYIVNELKKLQLTPQIQVQNAINKKWRASTTTENIITKIKGTSNGKALLLLTHYDSNPHSSLGASDAGSGVVTILESLRAFLSKNKQPKNDIIILFSDAEELGLLGAQAFVENHPWAKDVGLVLNFEARGSGGPSYMLMETNGKNSKLLTEFLKANPNYPAANSLMYSIYKMLPNDTDLTVFRKNANISGFNFAFIGDHFDYHTAQDSYEKLDRETLLHQADYLTTGLNYFSESDLSNLSSNEDLIYINFPIIGLLTFPFSWILPLFLTALVIFLILIFYGISKRSLTVKGILKGFIPLILSLLIVGLVTFGVWKLLLIIHPQYQDILHGFTYNGYQYIVAFSFLSLWILFKIYTRYFITISKADILVAPISLWLIINFLVFKYLQGAGFYIIPVYISLLIFSILIFMNIREKSKPILFAILSIPTIYIFAPFIKMFPVGLGLKVLFLCGVFIVLVISLLIPIFHNQKKKNLLQFFFGFLTILFFCLASFNSGFSIENKKPNSLVFVQNSNKNISYWATYNKTLDTYTNQIFGDDDLENKISFIDGKSKYNTNFSYSKKAENKKIKTSNIIINLDTIIDNKRNVNFTITPTRKIDRYEFKTHNSITLSELSVNGTCYDKGNLFKSKKGTLLIYQMANSNKDLTISFTIDKNIKPDIILNEISYDLLSNPKFNLTPRNETMMPMPFVVNDAIITIKKIEL